MTSRAPRPTGTLKRFRTNHGKKEHLLLATAGVVGVSVWIPPDDDGYEPEPDHDGNPVVFEPEMPGFPRVLCTFSNKTTNRSFRRNFTFPLSSMTEFELLCLRDSVCAAVDHVLPMARILDDLAKDPDNESAISNKRRYREVPSIRFGNGESRAYIEGLRSRFGELLDLVWPPGRQPPGDGDSRSEVADDDSV